MTRLIAASALIVLASPAAAQAPDWGHAPKVDVALSSFKYAPSTIHLRAGQPVVLHLANVSGGGHDFTAPEFFAAAQLRAGDRAAIKGGSVELRGKQSRDIALVPKAGRYRLKCSHTFHKSLGMTGEIVVD
jgi:uncharacterized cupredoxin-like copper-binding protein